MKKIYFYHRDAKLFTDSAHEPYSTGNAIDSWIVPPYRALKQRGWDVFLVDRIEVDHEILVVSSYDLQRLHVPEQCFVVEIVADGYPQSNVDFSIVQNWEQAPFCDAVAYIPHWPQPDLKPRNSSRGNLIETLAYFGNPLNLHPELRKPRFQNELRERLGVQFECRTSDQWNDYTEIDLTVSLRPNERSPWCGVKPATKLTNSWLAGVHSLAAPETSILQVARPGIDFIPVRDLRCVFEAVEDLIKSPEKYNRLVARSRENGVGYSESEVTNRWQEIIENLILPASRNVARSRRRNLFQRMLYRLKRRGSW